MICLEVWVCQDRWEAAGCLVGAWSLVLGGLASQMASLICHGLEFESCFHPFLCWVALPHLCETWFPCL